MSTRTLAVLAALAAVFLSRPATGQPVAPGDHFLCYRAKAVRANPPFTQFEARTGDVVVDEFSALVPGESHQLDLQKVLGLCTPADKNDEGVTDPDTHLESYKTALTRTSPSQSRPYAGRLQRISNQFGELVLRVGQEDRLLVPSAKAVGTGGAPPLGEHAVDHFKCYRAKFAVAPAGQPAFPPFIRRQVTIADQFGTRVIDIRKPTRLCNPADKNGEDPSAPTHAGHLVCYQARIAHTSPRQPQFVKTAVSTNNQFGSEVLSLTKLEDLCVPSFSQVNVAATATVTRTPTPTLSATPTLTATRTPTPTHTGPTPTPIGTPVALRINPDSRTVNVGGTGNYTANLEYVNGATQNATQQVTWSSSDDAIATISNDAGTKGRATGVAAGTATISAADPGSGLTSTGSNSDATITVTGPLLRIVVTPATATIDVGEDMHLVATGHYEGGTTRNITQQVLYAANDNAVDTPNEVGDRSRIVGASAGTARVTAMDPGSGITSTSSDSALITVRGPLQYITLSPLETTKTVGDILRYTATGHYQGGSTKNLTQQVNYASSDTGVAITPNAVGDKSRVECVGAGITTITATDPQTGITSAPIDSGELEVLGPLESITLSPTTKTLNVGQSQSFTATGHYEGGGTRNLTQQLDYASSAPGVAVATNTPGNKSKVDAVGAGMATISATDPVSGVSSTDSGGDAVVTVP
jgi:hypothetical protein